MNILVVGGAGYIGGLTTDLLMEQGWNVRVYDSLVYEESYRKPVDFVFGDIRDAQRLKPHLQWADAVVWLAALVGDPACAINPALTKAINEDTVKWLTENYGGRIAFLSTCSVYGAQDGVLDENSPTNPLSVYAATKLEAEHYLSGKNAIIFRLGTIFGVGDLFSRIRLDLVVNFLTVKAHMTGKVSVFGGEQFRPLLHVRDVARAVTQTIGTAHTGVFNLQKQNVRIIDLAYQIRNHFPELTIERTEMHFQDTRNYRVSSENASTVLGFVPECSIDMGIEEIKKLLDMQRIKDFDNPRYSNQRFLATFGQNFITGTAGSPNQ
ncbi:MAG: NAD(P)-dependent oxidoreductase [Thermodesulfobacteriota bacterium]